VTDLIQRLAASLGDRDAIERELGAGGMATGLNEQCATNNVQRRSPLRRVPLRVARCTLLGWTP